MLTIYLTFILFLNFKGNEILGRKIILDHKLEWNKFVGRLGNYSFYVIFRVFSNDYFSNQVPFIKYKNQEVEVEFFFFFFKCFDFLLFTVCLISLK